MTKPQEPKKPIQQNLENLSKKEVSRKEFLTIVGVGAASIAGLSTILRLLGHHKTDSDAYGRGLYGR